MHAVALSVMMLVGGTAECRRDDCNRCFNPRISLATSWNSFWCNIAKPADVRLQNDPWPLEYPGARERGWKAHTLAVPHGTPLNDPRWYTAATEAPAGQSMSDTPTSPVTPDVQPVYPGADDDGRNDATGDQSRSRQSSRSVLRVRQ